VAGRSGVRIEQVGTGNPGAANVRRSVGARAGALVLLLDAGKGAAPVLAGRALGADEDLLGGLVIAPVVAHIAVGGGRGVGAALGGLAALDPPAVALVSPIFLGGSVMGVHAPSVLLTYAALPATRLALGRSRRSVAWSAALVAILTLTRFRGAWREGGLDRRSLWERLVNDRGPAPAGER
jgi:glycerol-3-phosphate acyltransferase PlsY